MCLNAQQHTHTKCFGAKYTPMIGEKACPYAGRSSNRRVLPNTQKADSLLNEVVYVLNVLASEANSFLVEAEKLNLLSKSGHHSVIEIHACHAQWRIV